MTPRHKLTKWSEWEIGQEYSWTNLRGTKMSGVLQEINPGYGWIRINFIVIYNWRNKFRKVHPVE